MQFIILQCINGKDNIFKITEQCTEGSRFKVQGSRVCEYFVHILIQPFSFSISVNWQVNTCSQNFAFEFMVYNANLNISAIYSNFRPVQIGSLCAINNLYLHKSVDHSLVPSFEVNVIGGPCYF